MLALTGTPTNHDGGGDDDDSEGRPCLERRDALRQARITVEQYLGKPELVQMSYEAYRQTSAYARLRAYAFERDASDAGIAAANHRSFSITSRTSASGTNASPT
jgi:hypothetical protein